MASGVVSRPEFLREVREGLSQPQKRIPGKYLWDPTGSALFERICQSPGYYLTPRETELLRVHAAEIADIVRPCPRLVELGSGASPKVRILLDALAPDIRRYLAVDISEEQLRAGTARLATQYPGLEIVAVCADYTKPLPPLGAEPHQPSLGFFAGATIGNFPPADVPPFLKRMRAALGPSWFLLGIDPNRDADSLIRAYADQEGLMAALHKNVLVRIRRELGGDLEPDAFRHEARVLDNPPRVEAHLVSEQVASFRIGDWTVAFARGESIHTDTSYKYDPPSFQRLARQGGWKPARCWSDPDGFFSLHLLRSYSSGDQR
jgi:dimethylhistidine N-methyltransferase